jgi:hypothetical protein
MSGHEAFFSKAGTHAAPVGKLKPLKPASLDHFTHVPEHLPAAKGVREALGRERDALRLGVTLQRAAMRRL